VSQIISSAPAAPAVEVPTPEAPIAETQAVTETEAAVAADTTQEPTVEIENPKDDPKEATTESPRKRKSEDREDEATESTFQSVSQAEVVRDCSQEVQGQLEEPGKRLKHEISA